MRKIIRFFLLIILFSSFFGINFAYSQSIPRYYKTAVKLYRDGYYSEARMLLLTMLYTDSLIYPFNLYSNFLVAMSYAKEAKIAQSVCQLKNLQNKIETRIKLTNKIDPKVSDLLCEVNYQIAKLYFFEKKMDLFLEAKEYFDSECLSSNKKIADELNMLEIASLIYDMQWNDALNRIDSYNLENHSLQDYLKSRIIIITKHKDKSPFLGGLLSLIPGLGHVYAGRISDGFRSLLFNSAFSGLTIYTAIHKEYLFTTIFGIIELTLYISNIYGGIDAVRQENAIYYTKNRDNLLKRISVSNIQIISIRKEIGL